MVQFSESAFNDYLVSISNNLTEIQSLANDLEANFINAFKTRFIVDQASEQSLLGWPELTKQTLIQTSKTLAFLYGLDNSLPAIMTVTGFEESPGSTPASSTIQVKGSVTTKTDLNTGKTELIAKVEATWTIC